jgi:uncharacterized protein YggE
MKKLLSHLSPALTLTLLLAARSVQGQVTITPAPPAAPSPSARGTISVSGTAQVLVVPDQIELRLGISTRNPDLIRAKSENDERIAAVITKLKALGLGQRELQTDAIHVQPEYRSEPGNPPVLTGYLVQRHLVVTLKEVGKFEPLLEAAIQAGANEVLNIQFCSTELRKHRDQARQMAIRAAREKGELFTQELGLKLGTATSITEQSQDNSFSSYSYYSMYGGYWHSRSSGYAMQNNISVAGGSSEPTSEAANQTFAPGQIRISAVVSVQFETLAGTGK